MEASYEREAIKCSPEVVRSRPKLVCHSAYNIQAAPLNGAKAKSNNSQCAIIPLICESPEPKGSSKGVPALDPDNGKWLFGFSLSQQLHDRERRREGNRLPVDLFVRRVLHHLQHYPDRTLGGSCGETARFLHRVVAGNCFCSRPHQPAPRAGGGCACDHSA